ncbi:uncharacterized mitochondrial protein AtMg00820-like [Malus sylvestris]|uniref:uncharacterized mitochondrial protein AtMg00820-like n=1 Tax=Malus sylvestris TaxID=3752 RepID=UPI0021ACE706|nr:uncharacterized mitochondrial protein AtMg00820-like [Malus sylvestris]
MVAEYDVGGLDLSGSTQPSRSNVSINIQENTPNDGSIPSEILGHTIRRRKKGHIPKLHFEVDGEAYICIPSEEDKPTSYKEELFSTAKEKWITAMEEKMSSMDKNIVWELVDLLLRRETIGNKWVLKIKRKADGSIDKYKARLMAKGYTQQLGVDYEETFSHVVRFASIHLILAIIAQLDLEL